MTKRCFEDAKMDNDNLKVEGFIAAGNQGIKLNVRDVLLRLLPTLTSLITELVITGKVNLKGKDSAVIGGLIALLQELLTQLEAQVK